jgi:hypothetical protein
VVFCIQCVALELFCDRFVDHLRDQITIAEDDHPERLGAPAVHSRSTRRIAFMGLRCLVYVRGDICDRSLHLINYAARLVRFQFESRCLS